MMKGNLLTLSTSRKINELLNIFSYRVNRRLHTTNAKKAIQLFSGTGSVAPLNTFVKIVQSYAITSYWTNFWTNQIQSRTHNKRLKIKIALRSL